MSDDVHEELPSDTDGNTSSTEKSPPRRRRSASRPAGPAAAAPEAIVVTAPVTAPEPAEPAAEEASAPDRSAPEPSAVAEPEQVAPRRRRRASRPAGRPEPIAEPAPEPEPVDATAEADDVPAAADPTGGEVDETIEVDAEVAADAAAPDDSDQDDGAQDDSDQDDSDSGSADASPTADDPLSAAVAAMFATPTEKSATDDAAALEAATDDSSEDDSEGEDSENSAEDDSDKDDSDDDDSRPRRRRRGGRRRRRGRGSGGGADDDEESTDSDDSDAAGGAKPGDQPAAGSGSEGSADGGSDDSTSEDSGPSDSGSDDPGSGDGGSDQGGGSRRRRRRRRRRGEDSASEDDGDDAEVVVKVREPRRAREAKDEITGIDGSTRMEAKRQRRREGRQASRRRTPILSEAEFLARREAVDRTMIIRQREDLSQIAVLEDDILVEHYVDRESATSLIGNVYLGRIQNVLPSMEAAFIDIGRGRNAVLYAGEVDWDAFGAEGQSKQIEKVLKSGQTILVQVTKDPVGAKGARLTNHVSIPGRYIVYSPGGHLSGISRKLPENERKRLKSILSDLVGEKASVVVRTAAEGVSEEELVRDVNRLTAQWEAIEKKVKSGSAPQQLYAEPDLTLRIVRDLFTEDFATLVVAGNGGPDDAFDTVQAYVSHVAPHLADRLQRWEGADDVFAARRLDEQIAKALDRKVYLPSGGSLIIDRTEAMTVVDVNTGKFTGSGGNLESTVTSNNLEAAEEIVRQLRLRDIGGIIVIDFIDMVLPTNRELLLRRLVECLGRDRTRHQVAEVTSLGLVQMTRKRIGTGLAEAFTEPCEDCNGLGYHTHDTPVESQHAADGGERNQRRGRSPRNKGRRGGSGNDGNSSGNGNGSGNGGIDSAGAGAKRSDGDADGGASAPTPTAPAPAEPLSSEPERIPLPAADQSS